jgi:hypothetical protein
LTQVQLSSAREAEKIEPEPMKLKSPLLEAAARERLLNTQQARKGLVGAVVWRFPIML